MSEEITNNVQESSVEPTSDDFLGQDDVSTESESVEETPETSTDEGEAETESADTETSETEESQDDSDELPDEQLKEFPLEVLTKYAPRYGFSKEEIEADPRLQRILKDKLNSDIYAKQLKDQQAQIEESGEGDEPTVEEKKPAEPTREERARLTAEHLTNIEKYVDQVNDPEVAKQFNKELNEAYSIKDPEKQAVASTKVFTKYMFNFMQSVMPDLLNHYLPQSLEGRYPDFGDMHQKAMYARAWEDVRDSDTKFAALPAYGARTSDFGKMMDKALQQMPNLMDIRFVGKDGKPLPAKQQAVETYKLVAKIATGQQVSPALVQKAAATAVKKKAESEQKRSLGKTLGAGQSKNSFGKPDSDDPLDAEIARFKKDSTPFGK